MKRAFGGVMMVALLAGCGGGSGVGLTPASKQQQQNVMVVDEGIDPSVPELQGKIAAVYTELCANGGGGDASLIPDGGPVDGGAKFDSLKQQLIAAFHQTDDSCHLASGISSKSDPMKKIAQYKQRWNAMIRANQTTGSAFTASESSAILAVVDDELGTFSYHGTATSTTVAHKNDTVRLVLVERQLMSEAQVQAGFTCFDQGEINQVTDLLNDPAVFAAAAAQPATLDADFAKAMTAHDVGFVNESFGTTARTVLEAMQSTQCPHQPIDLSRYFAVITAVDVAHAATLTGPAVLTVKAAGNDGANINTGADALDCNPGDPTTVQVGSYNPATGVQNTFSNFGACVDLFAPGQAIVTMYAGGWLLPVDGTSFAAPLTAWFGSQQVPTPFTVATARQFLLSSTDATKELLASLFPPDFFYTPGQVSTDAIVVQPARPSRHPPRRGVGPVDLHRFLSPLLRFRAVRGA
ncbi:MAG TPA: S8 family serine peptidase [Polyangia bacterium]|nr:S8 family serine peptidase [Polyangia bacterium]